MKKRGFSRIRHSFAIALGFVLEYFSRRRKPAAQSVEGGGFSADWEDSISSADGSTMPSESSFSGHTGKTGYASARVIGKLSSCRMSETVAESEIPSVDETPIANASERLRRRLEAYRGFARELMAKGFEPPMPSDVVSDTALAWSVTLRLPSVGGHFAAELKQDDSGERLSVTWFDHGTPRCVRTAMLRAAPNPLEKIANALDRLMIAVMAERERAKQAEFREITELLVRRSDLAAIAAKIGSPAIRASGNETGGFWFESPYRVRNGAFRLSNLELPREDQETATPVSHEISDLSFFRDAYKKRMESDFGDYERSLAIRFAKRCRTEGSGHPLLGFCRAFNWHKHPGRPYGPSDGDLNGPGSEPAAMYAGTALATLYAIANEYCWNPPAEGFEPNAAILPCDSGGGCLVTFWKVLKVLPQEAERRRRAGGAAFFRRDGIPIHLSNAVTAPDGSTFWPDLIPLAVRTEEG